jgi:hypothetical protein
VNEHLGEFKIAAGKWASQASLVKDAHAIVEMLDLDPQLVLELAHTCWDDDTAGMHEAVVRILSAVEVEFTHRTP